MGTWGVGLYQNDTSLDVKDQFEDMLKKGKTVEDITAQLLAEFSCLMGDPCEESSFWLALADTQWKWGMLQPHVKDQALLCIEKGEDLEQWQNENPKKGAKRKEVLDKLQIKLLSPQPPVRKPVNRRLYKCQWNIGDVYAYQLESDLAKERGLFGRYFLIQKVDEDIWYPGHIVPIIYVKITEDDKLPDNIEQYDQLEYVQVRFSNYEDRFLPIDGSRPEEDIAEKSKIRYEVDEYGLLPHFRITLLNTSKKVIPSKLLYVGNFENAAPPPKEFIPHSKTNIATVSWKLFDETFESKMIKLYCYHNLRELEIYSRGSN